MSDPNLRHVLDRRAVLRLGAGLGAGAFLAGCSVQTGDGGDGGDSGYPERSVELIVPFAPGGSTDLIARTLGKAIEKPLGQSMVIINRDGAAAAVGTKEVASAKGDGYKIGFPPSSLFTLTPQLGKGAATVSLDELRVVIGLTVENIVLVAHKDSPFKTIDDVIALRGSGRRITYGHSGVGTGAYFAQTAFYKLAGINATDVPFGGGGPAVTAVLGKQVDIGASQPAESMRLVQSGELRWLGVFSQQRSPSLPDLPTAAEKGFDLTVDQARFIAGPKSMPDDAVTALQEAFREAVKAPEYDDFLKKNYIDRFEVDGAEVTNKIKGDFDRYKALIDRFGLGPK
ncbi:Bug family tripartite tricarboxylate transporter substrate binding protein [Plantactinospora endophytica]|uniref:ABC transporter substrate-binding protein n=1 Tax=Plantactinospora endophytica TaxID=673535 RepID=A0ABQ4E0Q1_9ACTN|nr:tripartite tricarboxylate transporter substrate binding protein [Plantactinospora endophytica]GIG88288.1 ABC transporter substrate-binding protein [Plantactinospora endophytica]